MKHALLTIPLAVALWLAPPCGAFPGAAEEAAQVPAHIAAVASADPEARSLALEWLLNVSPASVPLVEKAAAQAKAAGSPAAARLVQAATLLRGFTAFRDARDAEQRSNAAWNLRTALDEYGKFGHRNPAWDDLARRGLSESLSTDADEQKHALRPLHDAIVLKGCGDPLVLFEAARKLVAVGEHEGITYAGNYYLDAAERIHGSGYSPYRELACLVGAVQITQRYNFAKYNKAIPAKVDTFVARMAEIWPRAASQTGVPFGFTYSLAKDMIQAEVGHGMDRKAALDATLPAMRAAYPGEPGLAVFEGDELTEWAWDARGTGWANTVTPEGWKLFHERLARAADVLGVAYDAHPTDPGAPTLMLGVAVEDDYSPEQAEVWYRRAVRANPDRRPTRYDGLNDPYTVRLGMLQPRWGGSEEAMLAFGRDCFAGRNWRGNVPFMLAKVHLDLANSAPDADAYFRRPEVWADLDPLTARFAALYPEDARAGTLRAYWAWRCGRWAVADAELKRLGDRADADVFGGPKNLATARKEVAERARDGAGASN